MSQFIEMFGTPFSPKYQSMELGDICQIKSGTTFKADEEKLEGDVPYSKVADMNLPGNEIYLRKSTHYVDCNVAKDFYLPKGTVIFPKRGAAINTNKKRILQRDTCVDLNIIGVIPSEKICSIYLYWYFRCIDLSEICDNSGIPQINNKHLIPLTIGVPPSAKQNEFEQIFHQADKSEFDGIKSQFIEMTGDPRTNPKGWPIKKLPELATYSIGLTYKPEYISEDGTIVLRSGNIQNSKIDLTDIVRVNCPIKESIYVHKNDILMCSRNGSAALVGKVAQIKDIPEPMTYGAFMTVIRSEYSDFLYLYFQSDDFRGQVSTGKSSTMNQITQNMLDKISVPFPDEETRNQLSVILHQADKSECGCEYSMAS